MTFTPDQYRRLSAEHKQIILLAVDRESIDIATDLDETLDRLGILTPSDGCIPEEFLGDDLLESIIRKIRLVYATAARLAEQKLKLDNFSLCTIVQPCHEDRSHVVIYQDRRVLLDDAFNVWNLHAATLADLANQIESLANGIVATATAF